jgi:hypothetical protein
MLVLAYNGFWVNFTNSAKGSDNRLPIETEPRTLHHNLEILLNFFDAEYTEASL